MGWLFKSGYSRKDMIEEQVRNWQATNPDGTTITTTCLAHCYRGGVFSGVLWAIWERTFTRDDQQIEPTQRWITCDLLRYEQGEWGVKGLEEAMHPYFYSCPLKYLDLVPLDEYGGSAEWRELVRSWHARQAVKRHNRRAARSR